MLSTCFVASQVESHARGKAICGGARAVGHHVVSAAQSGSGLPLAWLRHLSSRHPTRAEARGAYKVSPPKKKGDGVVRFNSSLRLLQRKPSLAEWLAQKKVQTLYLPLKWWDPRTPPFSARTAALLAAPSAADAFAARSSSRAQRQAELRSQAVKARPTAAILGPKGHREPCGTHVKIR